MGGYLADHIGRSGYQRGLSFIAIAMLLTAAFNVAVFMAPTVLWCLLLFVIPSVTNNLYLAPVLSQAQSLVSLRMRAVASSLVLLVINVIGLAIGSPVTGLISDLLEPTFGNESMRYSLLLVSSVLLPLAAWCYYQAGCSIDQDLLRADEHD
jgi:MFS family permease